MKRLSLIAIFLTAILSNSAFAMVTEVSITGPEELTGLKDTIIRTVQARSLSRGVDLSKYDKLNIGISQLGDVYSFDAILDTSPPRAFHKDMKSTSDLTSTIDEMIMSLFGPVQASQAQTIDAVKDVDLDFKATSIALMNEVLYISDKNNIYQLKDGVPSVWWTLETVGPIYRIWVYKDTIIALCKHTYTYNKDIFFTYQLRNGKMVEKWTGVVLPMGDGLVRTDISMPPDITQETNRWSSVKAIDGNPDILPSGMDPLASSIADILSSQNGKEVITFSSVRGNLLVYRTDMKNPEGSGKEFWKKAAGIFTFSNIDKNALWSSEAQFSRLPLYLQQTYIDRGRNKGDDTEQREMEVNYFMPPRIVVLSNRIITIDNNQGLWAILDKITTYKSSQIRVYTWNGNDVNESIPMRSTLGYCADFAVDYDNILALVVTDKGTKLRTVNLKGNIK